VFWANFCLEFTSEKIQWRKTGEVGRLLLGCIGKDICCHEKQAGSLLGWIAEKEKEIVKRRKMGRI